MAFKMKSPMAKRSKVKGGGTKKVCLPKAKVMSMSKAERAAVVRAKRSAAKGGKYKISSLLYRFKHRHATANGVKQ